MIDLHIKACEGSEIRMRFKTEPQKPFIYDEGAQRRIEDVMCTHSTYATHLDEMEEIPPGVESKARKDVLTYVSAKALVHEVY